MQRWSWGTILGGVLIIPCLLIPWGHDAFRFPKEVCYLAVIIIVIVLTALGSILGQRNPLRTFSTRPVLSAFLGVTIAWLLVATLHSSNPMLSVASLIWTAGVLLVFLVTTESATDQSIGVVHMVLWPAALNGLILLLQEWEIWTPFTLPADLPKNIRSTALMGNPNDVGALLVPAVMAAIGLAVAIPRRRVGYAAVAILLSFVVFISQTLTAIAALAAGVLAFSLVLFSWRGALIMLLTTPFLTLIAARLYGPLWERLQDMLNYAARGDYNAIFSWRATSFLAAMAMARENLWTGVGPGCFGWNYFPYKLMVELRYPAVVGNPFNFAEVHNDYLETLAESGLPALLLLLTGFGLLSSLSKGSAHDHPRDARVRFARVFSFPLAISVSVLALAGFPLQLAGTIASLSFLSAVTVAWSGKFVPR